MNVLVLTGHDLTIGDCGSFLAHSPKVQLSDNAIERMQQARAVVRKAIDTGDTVYGVNTGFGKLSDVRIANEQLSELQVNLVRSHAAGVGEIGRAHV